ncbi:hypothetical protein V6N11_019352 [Hibiscus sabdariffa]|uniref:RNase H type-1 domain-containing protein n=1 Tax=Hibiscus sabdariffa TaxID=183260 RepID=A0ABR2R2C1_9ROSI
MEDRIVRPYVKTAKEPRQEADKQQSDVAKEASSSQDSGNSIGILCFDFNVDGVVRLSDSIATCGGLVRDENSNWIISFFRSLGCCHVLFAELWRVHDALKHIWSMGHKHLVIETNNVEVVELLNGNLDTRHRNTLVSTIQHILHLDWKVWIHKIERDYNRAVNALASAS